MTNLIILFAVVLFLPCSVIAQNVNLPLQTTGSLTGTVTANGTVVPYARITITNVQSGAQQTVTTNEYGSYTVTGLAPGSYVVMVGSLSGAEQKQVVEIGLSESRSLNFDLGDVPRSSERTSGTGKTPPAPSPPDEQRETKSPPTESRRTEAAVTKSPSTPQREPQPQVSEQSFDNDIDLIKWLDESKKDRKRLRTIIPVGDTTSVFVFESVKSGTRFYYSASLITQSLDARELSIRLDQNKRKTFIGVHRISPTSYLMVFYEK